MITVFLKTLEYKSIHTINHLSLKSKILKANIEDRIQIRSDALFCRHPFVFHIHAL